MAPIKAFPFGVHPSVAMQQAMLDNMAAKTGHGLNGWRQIMADLALTSGPDQLEHLKSLGVGTAFAKLIVDELAGNRTGYHPDALVMDQLTTKPQHIPLYEVLMTLAYDLGDDVRACPTKTLVPIYRHHVIAQIKFTTQKRVDLGVALKGADESLPKSLIATGGLEKGDRITHRFGLEGIEDITDEVRFWLKRAYQLDQ